MPANKLFRSNSACWLTILFLLIIGNHHVSGTSTCPYRLLQSAFKVQVDLEDNADAAGIQQQIVCSTDEKNGLAELIEKGIQKASKKVAESSKRFSFDESGASICKVPEEEETRRLSDQLLPIPVRNLESHHRFRYYGGMRCNYCSKDNADPGRLILPKPRKPVIIDCSLKWKTMKVPRIDDKTKLYLHVSAPKSADAVKLELVLHPLGEWNGEHIFVSMNEFNIDLGGFHTTADDVARSSADLEKKPAILWAVEPASTTQLLKVTLQVPIIPLVLGNHKLNVEVFFGGNKDESETKRGRIEQLNVQYAKDHCFGQSTFRKPVRRLVSTPLSSPVSSPVSSPTVSGPITSPASSPVIAPKIHMGARTERRRGKNKREIKNIISSDKKDKINVGGEISYTSLSNKRAPNPPKKSVEKKNPQVQKTIVPKQGSSNMIATGASANQKNLKDANKRPRSPKIVVSVSRQSSFRNRTQNILTSVLDNDLKVVISKPGHCMYGKEIKAVVHLTPKPEWEKNLPICKN